MATETLPSFQSNADLTEQQRQIAEEDSRSIAALRQGDPHAFDSIFQRHNPRLQRELRRKVDPDLAEDVAQQTFLQAWQALDRGAFEDRGRGLGGWLGIIASNLVRSHFRAQRSRPQLADRPVEDVLALPAAENVERTVIEQDELRRQIGAISPALRDTAVGYSLSGLTMQEFADEMGIPHGTVKSRVSRARDELEIDPTLADIRIAHCAPKPEKY